MRCLPWVVTNGGEDTLEYVSDNFLMAKESGNRGGSPGRFFACIYSLPDVEHNPSNRTLVAHLTRTKVWY
jgi:hypothetical protein